jgi:hypothetical protein
MPDNSRNCSRSLLPGQLPPAIRARKTIFRECEAFFLRRSQYYAEKKIDLLALHWQQDSSRSIRCLKTIEIGFLPPLAGLRACIH